LKASSNLPIEPNDLRRLVARKYLKIVDATVRISRARESLSRIKLGTFKSEYLPFHNLAVGIADEFLIVANLHVFSIPK
jgi:hypothetical protein